MISSMTLVNTLRRLHTVLPKPIASRCNYSTEKKKEGIIPKNVMEPMQTGHLQCDNGKIHDKRPFKLRLEAGKVYSWCLCGWSKSQPICDGFHKNVHFKIKLKPIRFTVEKTGDYWLCNCKQTKHRPFCDGTHKEKHIQDAIRH